LKSQVQLQQASADKTSAEAQQIRLESALRVAGLAAQIDQAKVNTALAASNTERSRIGQSLDQRELMRRDIDLGYQKLLSDAQLIKAQAEGSFAQQSLVNRLSVVDLERQAMSLGIPLLRNKAAAADTWLGRVIMPWLSTAADAAGAADRIGRMVR
jgi:hypothetical protein